LILVATKTDLREIKNVNSVSLRKGKMMCREIGALRHLECSSKQDHLVMQLLGAALKAVQRAKEDEAIKCCGLQRNAIV
jgi:Ras family